MTSSPPQESEQSTDRVEDAIDEGGIDAPLGQHRRPDRRRRECVNRS